MTESVFDVVCEIEDFIDKSNLLDVWVEYCGFHGFIVHYNHSTRSLEVDAEELLKVIRASDKYMNDIYFLRELGVRDYLIVCTAYKQIYNDSKKKKLNKLFARIKTMFIVVGVSFYGDSSDVIMKFKDGRMLLMETSIFKDIFEYRLGFMLGMHEKIDLYENIKKAIGDFKRLRIRSV
jgi:hypothetical protein